MKWGQPTWYFFHSFAEKINKDFYQKNAHECNNIIKQICNNLPCEFCTKHAKEFLKLHPLNKIKTKSEFKEYLFYFHNVVNLKTNKKEMNRSILKKYENSKFENIVKYFIQNFKKREYVTLNFNNQLQRQDIIKKIINWLNKNRHNLIR